MAGTRTFEVEKHWYHLIQSLEIMVNISSRNRFWDFR